MKIAILSDIHANLEALNIVLKDCVSEKVDLYFFLGDYIGYYFQPNEVINRLKGLPGCFIKGNHEDLLLKSLCDVLFLEDVTGKYGLGIKKAIKDLTEENINWIKGLKNQEIIKLDNIDFHLSHGSPKKNDKYLYPDSLDRDFDDYCQSSAQVILVGHSHYPFIRCKNNKMIINPGSVGQAKDIGGMASWGIFNTLNQTCTLKKSVYNVNTILDKLNVLDTPNKEYLCKVLLRNR